MQVKEFSYTAQPTKTPL